MYCNFVTENDFVYWNSNPSTSHLPQKREPNIAPTAYIGACSAVIGDVRLSDNVFVACNVTLRADEGSPFFVGCNTNLQDGVILHGLAHKHIMVEDEAYSIYIGNHTSCAHGAVIHGPSYVGDHCFIGVRAVIFGASIGSGCHVGTHAVISGGVIVPSNSLVPTGAIIDTQEKADALGQVPDHQRTFSDEILAVNVEFPSAYKELLRS